MVSPGAGAGRAGAETARNTCPRSGNCRHLCSAPTLAGLAALQLAASAAARARFAASAGGRAAPGAISGGPTAPPRRPPINIRPMGRRCPVNTGCRPPPLTSRLRHSIELPASGVGGDDWRPPDALSRRRLSAGRRRSRQRHRTAGRRLRAARGAGARRWPSVVTAPAGDPSDPPGAPPWSFPAA